MSSRGAQTSKTNRCTHVMNSQDLIATLVITRTRTEGIMSHKCKKKKNMMTFESFGIVLLIPLINYNLFVVVLFAWIETSTKAKCCGLQECNLILRQWWRSSWNDRVIFLRIILPRILPPSPQPYDCLVCHNV